MHQSEVTTGNRATITIHTSPETRERLEKLATATQRSKSFLGNSAIEQYLLYEEEFIAGVENGLQDIKAGRVLTTAELTKRLNASTKAGKHKQHPA